LKKIAVRTRPGTFYYVRVSEIPKRRRTVYDAVFFEIGMLNDISMAVQNRAYTSPIWYTP